MKRTRVWHFTCECSVRGYALFSTFLSPILFAKLLACFVQQAVARNCDIHHVFYFYLFFIDKPDFDAAKGTKCIHLKKIYKIYKDEFILLWPTKKQNRTRRCCAIFSMHFVSLPGAYELHHTLTHCVRVSTILLHTFVPI